MTEGIGRVDLWVGVVNDAPYHRERGIRPLASISVSAVRISYDGYKQQFKEGGQSANFPSPDEAFQAFLALVLKNMSVPQYDVRKKNGTFERRGRKERQQLFLDDGKFEIN